MLFITKLYPLSEKLSVVLLTSLSLARVVRVPALYVCIYMYVCMYYIYMHTYVYIDIDTYTCIYIRMYTHIYLQS